jgi:hypothetical protein
MSEEKARVIAMQEHLCAGLLIHSVGYITDTKKPIDNKDFGRNSRQIAGFCNITDIPIESN